jgi:hypothetical protein
VNIVFSNQTAPNKNPSGSSADGEALAEQSLEANFQSRLKQQSSNRDKTIDIRDSLVVTGPITN